MEELEAGQVSIISIYTECNLFWTPQAGKNKPTKIIVKQLNNRTYYELFRIHSKKLRFFDVFKQHSCLRAQKPLVSGATRKLRFLRVAHKEIISSLIPAPQGAGLQQRVELFAHAKTSEIFAVLEDVIPPTLCFTAKSRRLFACARSKTSCCICCLTRS